MEGEERQGKDRKRGEENAKEREKTERRWENKRGKRQRKGKRRKELPEFAPSRKKFFSYAEPQQIMLLYAKKL